MNNYDIDKLKSVIAAEKIKAKINKTIAKDSDDCLLEVTVLLKEFFDFIYTEKAETVANGIIALDNWISNRTHSRFRTRELSIGEVYMADLGLGYSSESGYYHPVIILEIIGATVMVLPVTSSPNQVRSAGTNKYLKPIEKEDFENAAHTLDSTSVAIMSNLRAMGPNRLLSYIGKIEMSKVTEIKEETVAITFGKIISDYKKQVVELEAKVIELEAKVVGLEPKGIELQNPIETNSSN